MFAFIAIVDDQPEFVQTGDGNVYTYSSEAEALTYFGCVKSYASLYRLEPDLSVALLVEAGDVVPEPPATVEPTEEQKEGIYDSYVYKSLLHWKPIPKTLTG
jgi:hypothetical protein